MNYTNEEIADKESLWDEYFNTSALPESAFNALSFAERMEMLNAAYPEY